MRSMIPTAGPACGRGVVSQELTPCRCDALDRTHDGKQRPENKEPRNGREILLIGSDDANERSGRVKDFALSQDIGRPEQ